MTVIYAKALCWIIVQTKSVKTVIYNCKLIIRLAAGTKKITIFKAVIYYLAYHAGQTVSWLIFLQL
jgi:hypothetical protein